MQRRAHRLRLAHRGVRLTRRTARLGRAAALALWIMRRYGLRPGWPPPADVVLRRARGALIRRHAHHRSLVYPAPRLALTTVARQAPAGAAPAQTARSAPPPPAAWVLQQRERRLLGQPGMWERAVHRAVARASGPVDGAAGAPPATDQIVRRLTARERRLDSVMTTPARATVDAGAAAARTLPGNGGSLPSFPGAAPPVARVLRRAEAAAAPAGEDGVPRTGAGTAPQGGWGWSAGGPAPADGAALDLGRLTDQIVQVIDQRIIAERERMGRV